MALAVAAVAEQRPPAVGEASEGQWLVKVDPGADPEELATSLGASYLGPIDSVPGYHRFSFRQQLSLSPDRGSAREAIRASLARREAVLKFEEDEALELYTRVFIPPDPRFPEQWHLENTGQTGGLPFADLGVRRVWDQGITGRGQVIGVIDTGIEYNHPDLVDNWLSGVGRDYIGNGTVNDNDPSPAADDDSHGTAVTGIAAAVSNQTGVIGIAYESRFVPFRAISYDNDIVSGATASEIADALSHIRWPMVDLYNNSWGPSDNNGVRYANISGIVEESIINGTNSGRNGRGTIYVWAAGNGGTDDDNSNFDGYNSLPYTISVAALGHDDVRASYSEKGANLLVAAPSQGRGPGILTTDNTGSSGYNDNGDEYDNFNGTSAASPMVAGVVALLLDRRQDLNWRDVQQILARTAEPVDYSEEGWARNAAGHWYSHEYGFGRVDAEGAIALAGQWTSLLDLQTRTGNQTRFQFLSQTATTGQINMATDMEVHSVRVRVQSNHSSWGDLSIEVISPSGTRSVLSEPHLSFGNPDNNEWTYLSTHFLGESSQGTWRIEIADRGPDGSGSWLGWGLEILGHFRSGNNRPPVAQDIEVVTSTYPARVNVLEGVVDPDGDALQIVSVHHPRDGSLARLANGSFEYIMGAPKLGRDMFSVLIADGQGNTLRRMVHFVNPRPIVQNDLYAITRGQTVDLPVLENDYDAEGNPLRIVRVSGEQAVYATILSNGRIRFSPPADLTGLVRLKYRVTDDVDGESEGWITLMLQDSADVALQFDGLDDYLRIPPTFQINMSDDITAEAWIYPVSFGEHVTGFGRIFDRDSFVFFINGFDH